MANDATEAEPFDVWWPKYVAEVEKSIVAAEQHLNVPHGTISSIPSDPDYIATIKTHAVIESMLNELIAEHPPQQPYEDRGPLGGAPQTSLGSVANENYRAFVARMSMDGRSGKIGLAQGLGLITKQRAEFIKAAGSVRNRYAHSVKNMHRSLKDILMEMQQNKGSKKIVEQVTGQEGTSPKDQEFLENGFLKMLMYHRLADYVADVLHTLHPPRLPVLLEILGSGNTPIALAQAALEASEGSRSEPGGPDDQ